MIPALRYRTLPHQSSTTGRCATMCARWEDLLRQHLRWTARGLDRISPRWHRISGTTRSQRTASLAISWTAGFRDARGTLWVRDAEWACRGLEPVPESSGRLCRRFGFSGLQRRRSVLACCGAWEFEHSPRSTLGNNQNNLQIEFFGIDFSAGESLHYQYKLEGADRDWSAPTFATCRAATRTLRQAYRFVVRAIECGRRCQHPLQR